MKLEVGKRYTIQPEIMRGMDGNNYKIITGYASGRDWAAKQYYALLEEGTIEVIILPNKENYYSKAQDGYHVGLLKGGNLNVGRFAKKPYVRKDGSFTVCSQDEYSTALQKQYGFWRVMTRKEAVALLNPSNLARARETGHADSVEYCANQALEILDFCPRMTGKYEGWLILKPSQVTLIS